MRKHLLIFVITVGCMFSCNQDEEILKETLIEPNNYLSIEEGILNLNSVEQFETLIESLEEYTYEELVDWGRNIGLESLLEEPNESYRGETNDEADELFLALLNSDGAIIIEEKLFQLDFKNEEVLVYNSLQDFKEKDEFEVYSFEDEVLNIVFELEDTEESHNRNDYCSSYNPGYKSLWNSNDGLIEGRIRYFKAGIYFSLKAKIRKASYGFVFLQVNTDNSGTKTNFYKMKKGKCNGNSISRVSNGNGKSHVIRTYYGTRRALAYNINVQYYYEDGSSSDIKTDSYGCKSSDKC